MGGPAGVAMQQDAQKTPAVHLRITDIHRLLEELENAMGRMQDRLVPVSNALPPPIPAGNEKVMLPTGPIVVNELDDICTKIRRMLGHVDRMVDALEI